MRSITFAEYQELYNQFRREGETHLSAIEKIHEEYILVR